jgi:hypothetical protein
MRKLIVAMTFLAAFTGAAAAYESPPLLVDSPCTWFVKTAPDVWSTNHIMRVDEWGIVAGQLSFGPGTYKVDDGTDAFELVERKCGRGAVPRDVYRRAMPLPFGLLPWYN